MKRLVIVICALLVLSGTALARAQVPISDIPAAALPREARATLALVKAGGPFPYAKDGSAFGNREKMLPPRRGPAPQRRPQ